MEQVRVKIPFSPLNHCAIDFANSCQINTKSGCVAAIVWMKWSFSMNFLFHDPIFSVLLFFPSGFIACCCARSVHSLYARTYVYIYGKSDPLHHVIAQRCIKPQYIYLWPNLLLHRSTRKITRGRHETTWPSPKRMRRCVPSEITFYELSIVQTKK